MPPDPREIRPARAYTGARHDPRYHAGGADLEVRHADPPRRLPDPEPERDPGEVFALIVEAMRIIAREGRGRGPSTRLVAGIDVVRAGAEAYGYDAARMPWVPPSAAEISRAHAVEAWLNGYPDDEGRRVVVLRALGVKWARCVRLMGRSERTLRSLFVATLAALDADLRLAADSRSAS